MEIYQKIIVIILAISVLVSYYIFLQTDQKYEGGYIGHPFWFGIQKEIVWSLVFFQILAAIGFVISIGSWMFFETPKKGAVANNKLFYALFLFFISAIVWPIATKYHDKYKNGGYLVVISLILTAIASIWLLAGAIEDEDSKYKFWRVIGLLFLCIVTVLGDGVIWNANYIVKNKDKFIYKL
jgi:hypothetical protein